MSLISDSIPNLIQGISQQPDSLRNVSQLESQEDCYSSAVEGLIRRPPTEHLAQISTTPLDMAFMHTINRDVDNRFKLILTNGNIQIFDLSGVAQTIDFIDEDLRILNSQAGIANGATYVISAAHGESNLDFTVSGITNTAVVILEGSKDGVGWTTLATTGANGTTANVAIANNLLMRSSVIVWSAGGSISSTVTYSNQRYLNIAQEILTLNDHLAANTTGASVLLNASPGESLLRFAASNTFVGNVTLQLSEDNATWTNAHTFTSETYGNTALLSIGDNLYARGVVSNYVSGVISSSVTLRTAFSSPSRSVMRAMTVADFTFLVNTEKIPLMESTLSVTRPYEGLVFVKQGNYGSRYLIYVDGTERGNITTSDTVASTIQTTDIANQLYQDLVAWAGAGYSFALIGSVIHISNSIADFKLRVSDPHGGNDIQVFKDITPTFSELPTEAPDLFKIAIDADLTTDQGKYYVEATVNQTGETFGPCTWRETLKSSIPYRIDASLMPYAVVHNADNTFSYGQIDWADRLVGTDISCPDPTFIGSTINDLFFYKNRLGFLSEENFILSETAEYFNFFRTTMIQIKDTDIVDARATHIKVSILRRAVPYNRNLMMFSDLTQFIIPADTPMTPKTVRADVVSEYTSTLDAAPVNAGRSIFYMFHRGDYEGMGELTASETVSDVYEGADVSTHVPSYIPAGASAVSVSVLAGVAALLTTGDPDSIYLYKTEFHKGQKLQEAWFRWTLGQYSTFDTTIINLDFIENTLYLLVQRNGEVFLEQVRLVPNRVDPDATYVTFLDRRIQDTDLNSVTYHTANNTSTLELPYTLTTNNMLVVTRSVANNEPYMDLGRSLTVVNANVGSTTITVRGNVISQPLWTGERFLSEAELSKIYVRKQSVTGGVIIDAASKLQLLKGSLVYSQSGPFTVRVIPVGRDASDYIFTGRLVGDTNNILGQLTLPGGRFNFSILSNNERVRILFRTDSFLPFHLSSLEWEGNYVKRSGGR